MRLTHTLRMKKRLNAPIKAYYRLTKPGIIYGNLFTAAGGFLYGTILRVEIKLFILTMLGIALVMASGCVINNYFDRDIDAVMKRTKRRALVSGTISPRAALVYGGVLGISGLAVLAFFVNSLTALLGVIAFVSYAFVYTFAKRRTVHATLIGTFPGALPPVAGYTAATGRIDTSALLLFLILVSWQMTHFYAIAIFRIQDYRAVKIPVLPAVRGMAATKLQMTLYTVAFMVSVIGLAAYGYAGLLFLAIMVPLALWWLIIIVRGWHGEHHDAWARKVFLISLIILPTFSVALALNAYTP